MKKVLVVAGPTASGKTGLGVLLAQRLGGEVVSADSMQVYRTMDVGTAKVTPEEMQGIPHHMIDVADPEENYSVARYVEEAAACCEDILSRGRLPVIVGGTGLYIDSLLSGRSFAEARQEDPVLRAGLEEDFTSLGGEAMLERLRSVDPDRAARLNAGDRRRILRALEVYALTGQTATAHDEQTRLLPPRYDALRIVLSYRDRQVLYDHIDRRADRMVEQGLFREVGSLLDSGVSSDCTSMQAIGYKEAAAALRGEITRQEALAQIKLNSRRYAKRQLTWFRRWENAVRPEWEDGPDPEMAWRLLEKEIF